MTAKSKNLRPQERNTSSARKNERESADLTRLVGALEKAANCEELRHELLRTLRIHQDKARDPQDFAEHVRWPIVKALVALAGGHRVKLKSNLVFEVLAESNIEKSFLLSAEEAPDHVWEPQTTRLLLHLARGPGDIVIGGAYIGDQAVLLGHTIKQARRSCTVHAFEPFKTSYRQLCRNVGLNNLKNVRPVNLALWDKPSMPILLKEEGPEAPLATPLQQPAWGDGCARSTTIDTYARRRKIRKLSTIMLDLEGGEEKALHGAESFLDLPADDAPVLVFEVHRSYVNWSRGLEETSIVKFLRAKGYQCFAIRDYHANKPMSGTFVEIIPAPKTYLKGPPHGFNMLAFKSHRPLKGFPLAVVNDVSPKYLDNRNPKLHAPVRRSLKKKSG
jgi:FkbM family methyltransferase